MEISQARANVPSGRLLDIFDRLYRAYGPQRWWPGDSSFEVVIGAILTQSAAWTNVEKAIANLKAAGVLAPGFLRELPAERLAELLYPSGYFNAKARKVKAFVEYLGERYFDDLDRLFDQDVASLRAELLRIHGIGEETADSIILYAAEKPLFVVDAYTKRIFSRLGLSQPEASSREVQGLFMDHLPAEVRLYNEYHALIVAHGKDVCRKQPLCERCCLAEVCPYPQRLRNAASP